MKQRLKAKKVLRLSVRTESDNQGAGVLWRAGLEVRGQRWSREEDRVERRRLVAVSGDRREKDSGAGRTERTEQERSVGESERRLRREETMWGGDGCEGVEERERERHEVVVGEHISERSD